MTLTKILRDRGLAEWATVHGFRSTFRDWCAETGKPREMAEAVLAHTVGGVEGAYFRSDLLARRRVLMDQWVAFVTGAVLAATRSPEPIGLTTRRVPCEGSAPCGKHSGPFLAGWPSNSFSTSSAQRRGSNR